MCYHFFTVICWESVQLLMSNEQFGDLRLLGDGYREPRHGRRGLFAPLQMWWDQWIFPSTRVVKGSRSWMFSLVPAEHVKEVCWWPSQKYRPACESIATSCRSRLKVENLVPVISTNTETITFWPRNTLLSWEGLQHCSLSVGALSIGILRGFVCWNVQQELSCSCMEMGHFFVPHTLSLAIATATALHLAGTVILGLCP